MNITGMVIMIDMMRRREIFTDPEEKQNINPWKMKLLSCLTLGVLGHNSYCVWIMSTSDYYSLHNPRGLQVGAIIANICEMRLGALFRRKLTLKFQKQCNNP